MIFDKALEHLKGLSVNSAFLNARLGKNVRMQICQQGKLSAKAYSMWGEVTPLCRKRFFSLNSVL